MNLRQYQTIKYSLVEILRSLPWRSETALRNRTLFERLAMDRFNVAVVGRYSRGKSTLLNALTGLDRLPMGTEPITVASVHLCPNSPEVRLREAAYLAALADERAHVLIGGDFNSVSPHDPEPPLAELPPRFRFRYADETGRADHRTLAALERAGFVDVGHVLDSEATRTVPGASFSGTEFVPFRCDYFLARPLLAAKASGYRVIDDAQAGAASDHYPLVCAFS